MPLAALEQQLLLLSRRLSKPILLEGPAGAAVLDRPAYQCLWRVVEEGPLRPTALAALLEVDLSVASRQVKALEDLGLLQRCPDPADARAALVSPTAAGLTAFARTREQRTAALTEVLSGWSAADRKDLVRLLGRFNGDLEAVVARRASAAS